MNSFAQSRSFLLRKKYGIKILQVVGDAFLDAEGKLGAFDDQPPPVADVVERLLNGDKIRRAFAIEVFGVLGVDLADPAAQKADLPADIVAPFPRVGDIVVDPDGLGADGVDDLDVILGAEP